MSWSTVMHLQYRDLDYLGHVTASAYLALFEEARTEWMSPASEGGVPTYVVARQLIDYRRELLIVDGPVTLTIAVERIGKRSVDLQEALMTSSGELRTVSAATLVMWNRDRRRSRPISSAERALFDAALESPA